MTWKPIETAPKNEAILLYGEIVPLEDEEQWSTKGKRVRAVGYWDGVDEAWASSTSSWTGPWLNPTHWMPLPDPPDSMLTDRLKGE